MPNEYNEVVFSDLTGKTLRAIFNGADKMIFEVVNGQQYRLYHSQNCCEETVTIEDIAGDLNDLLHTPILIAEEVTNSILPDNVDYELEESETWTFYKLATIKGSVTIRWHGTSNGYYSERVDFEEIT